MGRGQGPPQPPPDAAELTAETSRRARRLASVGAVSDPAAPGDLIEPLRLRFGARIRQMLAGSGEPPVFDFDPAAPRWFGPDSAIWAVHSDVAMLVGGVRALFLQTLHPLAIAGVTDHSDYRSDPLGRLQRTAAFLATTAFGTADDAEAAVARVRAIHDRVTGTAPDGRPYAANDPRLLGWVHCTETDSFLRAHQRYGAVPLAAGDADRYVAEMAEIGLRLGVESPPTDTAELAWALEDYRPELEAGELARRTVRFLLLPPLPAAALPPYGLIAAAAIGLLPGYARTALRLPRLPLAEPVLVAPAATGLLWLFGWALGEHPSRSLTAASPAS